MAPRKATAPAAPVANGVITSQEVAGAFPVATRSHTKLIPYIPDVEAMVTRKANKFYPVPTEDEAKSLANSLRSIARRQHDHSLEVVYVPEPTATHKQGLYVRDGGPIKARGPRKATAATVKAPVTKAPATKATKATKAPAARKR